MRWTPAALPECRDAPTHASLVKAKYGDRPPRQPQPNANRGDNLTGASPYQDTDPELAAEYPLVGLMGTSPSGGDGAADDIAPRYLAVITAGTSEPSYHEDAG